MLVEALRQRYNYFPFLVYYSCRYGDEWMARAQGSRIDPFLSFVKVHKFHYLTSDKRVVVRVPWYCRVLSGEDSWMKPDAWGWYGLI